MAMQNPFWGNLQDTGAGGPMQGGAWGANPQTSGMPVRTPVQPPSTGANPFLMNQRGPAQVPAGLYGRVVTSPDDIMPNEVPMDGTPSFFPKDDFSCIYGRKWMPDGRIVPVTFVPQIEAPADPEVNQNGGQMEEILAKLTSIEALINSLPATVETQKENTSSKKKDGEKK